MSLTLHMLVIEDEKTFTENAKLFLETEKFTLDGEDTVFETDVASNYLEANNFLAKKIYDAVLLDLQIPPKEGEPPVIEMGYDIWQQISKLEEPPCVIIVTAYGTLDRAIQTVKEGVYDFLQKPVTREHLISTVKKGIEFRRLSRTAEIFSRHESYKLQVLTESMSYMIIEILDNIAGDIQDIAELRGERLNFKDNESREIFDDRVYHVRLSIQEMTDVVDRAIRFVGSGQLKVVSCNLNAIIETTIQILSRSIKIKSIEIEKRLNSQLPNLIANQNLFLELVFNIFMNAIEAMELGGKLRIETFFYNKENSIRLEVIDTGKGISSEELKKVFQPFFTTKKLGTGMGLPICQKICAEMGGGIEIQSEQNIGTKVVVTLPIINSNDGITP